MEFKWYLDTEAAAEYYGVTPDFIVLGKAIGGGLPLGVTIVKDGLTGYDPDAEELHTFANSSLSQVASLKLLEIIRRDDILDPLCATTHLAVKLIGQVAHQCFP